MEKNRIIVILRRIAIALLVVLIVVLNLLAVVAFEASERKEVIRCAQYKTQPEAQRVFQSDPRKYADLDADKDGLACESLPSI